MNVCVAHLSGASASRVSKIVSHKLDRARTWFKTEQYLFEFTGIKCGEKGLNCSAMPDRKRVNRSGKRIEQARGAFGSAQQAQAQAHTPDPQQGDDRLEIIAGSTWLESEQSVGRKLGTQEIQAAVTNSLLDRQ